MKALRKLGLFAVIPVVSILMMFSGAVAQGAPCTECEGPGWVGSCPEGTDVIADQEVLVGIDLYPLGGVVDSYRLTPQGPPLTIHRDSSVSNSIQTEILNLEVAKDGVVVVAGIDQGQLASTGAIDGIPGDPDNDGESWFNVYVEVRNAGGGFPSLWNHTPIYILDTIFCVPPRARYIHLGGAIPLFDWPPGGSGDPTPRAYIVDAEHKVNPDTTFSGCGTLIQGVECVLFDSDDAGVYILSNYGSFGVGDRVLVSGVIPPDCISFCMEGDGCIDNTIAACPGDIPTLSEWGIIIFSLLVLSLITVVVTRRRMAMAGAGGTVDTSATMSGPLFVPTIYVKALAVTLLLAGIGLVVAFALSGTVALRDSVGTLVSAAFVAYIAHLWISRNWQ